MLPSSSYLPIQLIEFNHFHKTCMSEFIVEELDRPALKIPFGVFDLTIALLLKNSHKDAPQPCGKTSNQM